ncbi:MAG: hypothetical protein IKB38_04540 [Clostridia bacterium]|nr:hypothetical protein [Clostridia bacterium]
MTLLDQIKDGIKVLYEEGKTVHFGAKISHSSDIFNAPAKIIGVYPHIFRIQFTDGGRSSFRSVQYAEILTGQAVISELDYAVPKSGYKR